jgi:hypothetical protein
MLPQSTVYCQGLVRTGLVWTLGWDSATGTPLGRLLRRAARCVFPSEAVEFYETRNRPLLVKSGFACHTRHENLLRLMGFNHTKLTYRYSGHEFRLTDVAGKVVRDIIA